MDVETSIREYLSKTLHMSLATTRNNKPWVCELHFVFDDNLNLYFRSLKSRRHSQEIADNPHVAGNIVTQHSIDEDAHGIYFEGIAEMLSNPVEIQAVLPLFTSRLGRTDDLLAESQSEGGHQFYKVSVNRWFTFGKFGGETAEKRELDWSEAK